MFNKNTENFSELLLFPQKVLLYKCKGFDAIKKELVEYCYSLKNKSTSTNLTLNNGWQSKPNSHSQKRFESFLNFLNDNIESCLRLYQLKPKGFYIDTCVINIGGENSYHNSHVHPNTDISGVFWITIPNNSGEFVFENPSNFGQNNLLNVLDKKESENKKMYHSYHINPIEGHILFFPSNLRHSVNLNRNKKDRITIGFNVTFV